MATRIKKGSGQSEGTVADPFGEFAGAKGVDRLNFAQAARSLSRNPLGIIALFILLIYGIAGLVFGISSGHLDTGERRPLIWFLVLFPPVVFGSFLWLVVKHSLKLYAPSDFREDASFVQLNQKVAVMEVRQRAAEIDPRGDSDSAFRVLDDLLNAQQFEVAKGLAKAFLKVQRYAISLEMFDRIRSRISSPEPDSFLQYRAYSLIGLARYVEAMRDLETLRKSGSDKLYDFWPRLGLAYSYWKLGRREDFEDTFASVVSWPKVSEYRNGVGILYPELAQQFAERIAQSKANSHSETRGQP